MDGSLKNAFKDETVKFAPKEVSVKDCKKICICIKCSKDPLEFTNNVFVNNVSKDVSVRKCLVVFNRNAEIIVSVRITAKDAAVKNVTKDMFARSASKD